MDPFTYRRRSPENALLYKVVAENIETFFADVAAEAPLPDHVKEEFYAYLKCGILARGFMRLECEGCKQGSVVAFSCKKRGFCPSCGGKRMTETAAHLIDHVMPRVPIRQWVLSLPIALRYWMAANKRLTAKIHKLTTDIIGDYHKQKAKAVTDPQFGAVTFVQRFGSAVNLNMHLHMLYVQGVYTEKSTGPKFIRVKPPSDKDVAMLVQKIAGRIIKYLKRSGYLSDGSALPNPDPILEESPVLDECLSASVRNMIAIGARRGQPVRRIGKGFGLEGESAVVKSEKCAAVNGFSLHANVAVDVQDREKLEHLIRYTARPAIATSRLSIDSRGDILYELKKPWSDGTTHVKFSPMEFIEKLCALVPLPRFHLTRYSGVFAPHHRMRSKVVLHPEAKKGFVSAQDGDGKRANYSWSKLLARTFKIDVEKCTYCGGKVRIISAIQTRDAIVKILCPSSEFRTARIEII